jgi:hypothetical protein
MLTLLARSSFAANPFLDAKDDKPVSAKFRVTEWSDEIGRDLGVSQKATQETKTAKRLGT